MRSAVLAAVFLGMATVAVAQTAAREVFHLRPAGIIESLNLLRPIYAKTAAYGHFGRNEPEFTWEATDKAAALAEQASNTTTGGLDVTDAYFGPLNNPNQLARVEGFIARTPGHAEVVAGGHRVGERGYLYAPTVVSGLRQDDEMIQDEVFGPVITVQRFSDEDEAVAWANGTEYGLASSIWTSDHGRAMRVSRRLDFGCVWINTHIPLVAEMPHGGFKQSGYGKDLSMYGLEDYTRIKHVMSALD